MSVETADISKNKAIATQFIASVTKNGLLEALSQLSDDFTWWTAVGTWTRAEMTELARDLEGRLAGHFQIEIDTITAEDDRVAMEARSRVDLRSGKTYGNTYHYLFRIRDGRICAVREHCDTQKLPELM